MTEDQIAAFRRRELDTEDTPWELWVDAVERATGVTLDEDGHQMGYCIDWAYDAYLKGDTPADYAAVVRDNRAHRGL